MIREVNHNDIKDICSIYNYYIKNTDITFEEVEVTPEEMKKRVDDVTSLYPWYVYVENGRVLGYCYASKWKGRCAYKYSVESTLYVAHDKHGKSIGTELYFKLLEKLKNIGMHIVIAGIALPNDKSSNIHEKFGFRKVAHFSEVGFKNNRWIDVGYWELKLDERI